MLVSKNQRKEAMDAALYAISDTKKCQNSNCIVNLIKQKDEFIAKL